MRTDAMKEKFDVVELFDKCVLFTNFRIDRDTVPAGWHCYDIRGSDDDFGELATLEPNVLVNHAGSILSPQQIPFPDKQNYLNIKDEINFTEHHGITLAEFCTLHRIDVPDVQTKYTMSPASPEEAGLFYNLPSEKSRDLKTVLRERLDQNYKNFLEQLQGKSVSELIAMAPEITAAKQVHEELPDACDKDDVEFLLRFDDPLEVVRGYWESEITGYDHSGEMGHMLWEIRDKKMYSPDQLIRLGGDAEGPAQEQPEQGMTMG